MDVAEPPLQPILAFISATTGSSVSLPVPKDTADVSQVLARHCYELLLLFIIRVASSGALKGRGLLLLGCITGVTVRLQTLQGINSSSMNLI